ncbi:MAG: lysine--tRNA ligase [Myxococcota bacterium]|jgi:lysyl-tRNA synthetase class 2|nr:lysine--tRNA ligase [Myxococcota bacterium]
MSSDKPAWLDNPSYLKEQGSLVQARLDKLEALRQAGVQPYANDFRPQQQAGALQANFASLDAEALEARAEHVSIAGRIMAVRSFGKAAFIAIKDRSGSLQAHLRKDLLGEDGFELFKRCDIGDIVGVQGLLFRTKTGELTIKAERFVLLTKSLRPLPEKWHGLSDIETRLRQRYVDFIVNDEVREVFRKRAELIKHLRDYLNERGFLEVETPMMHATPGGAAAKPFVTHHNALDIDLYLRIAPELYLKRLVVGGFERVYEINRNFRNEGLSRRHNPEFTMLEFYWAYASYEELMSLTEEMLGSLVERLHGNSRCPYAGHQLDFSRPWRRLRIREAVAQHYGVSEAQLAERAFLAEQCGRLPEPVSAARIDGMSDGHLLMELFEQRVEHTLVQPTFVYEFPASVSPLSRRSDSNPEYVDRFELYVAGLEIANAFSELNDPIDQRQRFLDQLAAKAAGDDEAHPMDDDYVRALEYGMPPAAGEGIGIDRLTMLLTGAESIREVILFPLLRPES